MSTTPRWGLPLPPDNTLIATFPQVVRDQSRELENRLPAAVQTEVRAQVSGVAGRASALELQTTLLAHQTADLAGRVLALEDAPPPSGGLTAAELIASRLAFHTGDLTVGIASDSTSDGPTDWPRLWMAHLAERYPHLRIEVNQWNSATNAYGPTTVVQEGDGEPAFSGDVLLDTFTRTTDLATPDEGPAWEVLNPDRWTLDGTTARTTGSAQLKVDAGGRDMTSTTVLDVDTTAADITQNLRLYHGANNGMFAQVSVNTVGAVNAYIYRLVANTAQEVTRVNLTTAVGIPERQPATGPVTVTITGAIQVYTVQIDYLDRTWSHTFTIPEDAYGLMEPVYSIYPMSATPGLGIDQAAVAVADRPSTYQTLRVLSGTMGGGTLQYQLDHWADMFGDEILTPGSPELVETRTLTDTFTRTGPLAGTTTAEGHTWASRSPGLATDGTAAAPGAGVGSSQIHLPEVTTLDAQVELVTAAPPTAQTFRLGIRTLADLTHGLFLSLGISNLGALTIAPYVRTPTGGFRPFGSMTGHGIVSNQAAPQLLDVSITLNGLDATFTAGPLSATHAITEAEAAELGEHLELQAASAELAGMVRVLDLSAQYVHITPAIPPTYGAPLDVMTIGHGHNYGNRDGAAFLVILQDFLGHLAARRPATRVLLSSQNPQFPPTANPAAHADRQLALRQYAAAQGLSYAPVFEHFAAQPDGGRSWIRDDGVHPNAPATPTPTPGTGTSEWGRILADTVTRTP